MAAKIAALMVTLAAGLAAGVAILFFMLVAMNGYSEGDATWGLGAYVVLAFVANISMGLAAYFVTGRLIKRAIASLITITIFSIVVFVVEVVSSLIGIGVAEFVRVKF